jgi:hypothetical protein
LGLASRSYSTDPSFDPNKSKSQWERFANYVRQLNKGSGSDISHKVLILARHGEAYHNVGEKYYGTNCWNVSRRIIPAAIMIDKLTEGSVIGRKRTETKPLLGKMPI